MKKFLLVVVFGLLGLAAQSQPLLKTHVETGDVQGIPDGSLAIYRAIPYRLGRVSGCATRSVLGLRNPHVRDARQT